MRASAGIFPIESGKLLNSMGRKRCERDKTAHIFFVGLGLQCRANGGYTGEHQKSVWDIKMRKQEFTVYNYHTHTARCHHAFGTEREYIEASIEMGIKKLGFSDHIPCPFTDGYVSGIRMQMSEAEEYVSCIRRLAEEFRGRIQIFAGFEAEYIPEFYDRQMEMVRSLGCDYLIMGQHFWVSEALGPYAGTATEEDSRICAYVDSIIEGMETGSYSYLAHPDLMNYKGKEKVYRREMERLCLAMKELGIPLELNVLGMAGGRNYPDRNFWKIAGEVGNDVVFGLDAHAEKSLRDVKSYQKCAALAEKCGLHILGDVALRSPLGQQGELAGMPVTASPVRG